MMLHVVQYLCVCCSLAGSASVSSAACCVLRAARARARSQQILVVAASGLVRQVLTLNRRACPCGVTCIPMTCRCIGIL